MKLRFNGNSLRLRLSQTEIAKIAEGEGITEVVQLGKGNQPFSYSIAMAENLDSINSHFEGGKLTVLIPKPLGKNWATSSDIGLYAKPEDAAAGQLAISIEKDFQCLHKRPGEDESDNFPNPKA